MIEVLFFIFFVMLWINGFHAVTRPDKLLSFLGAYIKEQFEFNEMKSLLEYNKILDLGMFCADVKNKERHPQETDEMIGRLAIDFAEACQKRESNIEGFKEINNKIEAKLKTRKWKFILVIAPAWSECTECMSSLWSIFFLIPFSFIWISGFSYFILIPFAPICIAGANCILSSFRSSEDINF